MNFYNFSQLLIRYQELKSIPNATDYPQDINLSSEIWKKMDNLRKFTDKYNYEHSLSIFSIDNDTIITPITKGTKEYVISKEAITLEYKKECNLNLFKKVISINGKPIFSKTTKNIPKSPSISHLFGVHSHPIDVSGKYSFYSYEDYENLQISETLCQGLITDELLLLCRTKSPNNRTFNNQAHMLAELNNEFINTKNVSPEKLNQLNLLLYKGNLRKTLKRQS